MTRTATAPPERRESDLTHIRVILGRELPKMKPSQVRSVDPLNKSEDRLIAELVGRSRPLGPDTAPSVGHIAIDQTVGSDPNMN